MLTDFDQNTFANMTAALESVCNKIRLKGMPTTCKRGSATP
jgi:hypothetical protein